MPLEPKAKVQALTPKLRRKTRLKRRKAAISLMAREGSFCWWRLLTASVIVLGIISFSARAEDNGVPPKAEPPAKNLQTRKSICLLAESSARQNGLPVEFFIRLIWRESAFRPGAIGPVTRSGKRAQGIAQFMPGTAAEKNLLDPFDPIQALPKSAAFLRELRAEFGNLGLAAAAYNAGPRRVHEWLAGTGPMPAETRAYVRAITGSSVEDWAKFKDRVPEEKHGSSCETLTAMLDKSPSKFISALEQRVTASITQPWGVILGSHPSRVKVLARYSQLQDRHRAILAGHDPIVIERRRGPLPRFQIRVGADTRSAANALCARIHKDGGHCAVLRNRG
jgi:hypothetical protein